MERLKLGSLNINAGRDRNKLAIIAEFVKQIDIVFFCCKKHIQVMIMRLNGVCGGNESMFLAMEQI